MRNLYLILVLVTLTFSKENIDIEKVKVLNVKSLGNIEFFKFKVPDTNFYAIATGINSDNIRFNPDVKTNDEKVFQVLVDNYGYILKDFNFLKGLALLFTIKDTYNVYGNTMLYLSYKTLKKIRDRNFNDKEFSALISKKLYNPPLYPLRLLFGEAKIYTTNVTSNGLEVVYSKNKTDEFREYLKKHIFKDYYFETKVEEIYTEYINLPDNIFDCAVANDVSCIEKFIKYGYDINMQDKKYNQTLLMYATANGHYEMVKLLIDNKADPNIFPQGMENAYLAAERLGFNNIATLLRPLTYLKVRTGSNNEQRQKNFCHSLSTQSLKDACLGNAYATTNKNAKNIILGNCYSITGNNSTAMTQVCVNGKQGCYSFTNSDVMNACVRCDGSNRWLRIYAAGKLINCY